MSIQQALLLPNWKPVVVSGADFDGSAAYLTRGAGLTGAANANTLLLSFWFRCDGSDGQTQLILQGQYSSSSIFSLYKDGANHIEITAATTTPTTVLTLVSTTSYTTSGTWHHCLASWSATSYAYIYIDDVDVTNAGSRINLVTSASYASATNWIVGRNQNISTQYFNGCLAEFYCAPGQALDISSSANRLKFRTATGVPVPLGSDGSTPTGVAPLIYQKLVPGDAASTFATNAGSGGNFTMNGSLSVASSSPSG